MINSSFVLQMCLVLPVHCIALTVHYFRYLFGFLLCFLCVEIQAHTFTPCLHADTSIVNGTGVCIAEGGCLYELNCRWT